MKFNSIIRRLLIEAENVSKFKFLYNQLVAPKEGKTKGIMDFDTFKTILFADPTIKKPQGVTIDNVTPESENVQPGKYTNWLFKNYVKPSNDALEQVGTSDKSSPEFKRTMTEFKRLYLEDLFGLTELLKDFEKVKQYFPVEKRDINKISPKELVDMFLNLPEKIKLKLDLKNLKVAAKTGEKKNLFEYPGSTIEHVGPKYTVVKIEGVGDAQKEAAQYFGGKFKWQDGESHWCTSPEGSNAFMTYVPLGPLYVILANDDKGLVGKYTGLPQERYQFHFPKEQFMDRMDHQIKDLPKFFNDNPDLKDYFKDEWGKALVTPDGKKVEINYPSGNGYGGVAKYIMIYGFDSLFDSLPDDIQYLLIQNNSKENFALDVPETLGKFKNVKALMLDNVVKSLPNSIGDMTNLQFVTLSNNPNLKELPETMADLPKLSFITMRNAPNVIIPPRLAEKLTEEGNGFWYVTG